MLCRLLMLRLTPPLRGKSPAGIDRIGELLKAPTRVNDRDDVAIEIEDFDTVLAAIEETVREVRLLDEPFFVLLAFLDVGYDT